MSEGKPRNCLLVLGLKASELCLWSIGSSPLFPLCTWHCSGSCSDWNVCASMSPLTFPSSVVRMLCLSFLKPTVVGFMEQRLSTAHPVLTWGFAVFRDVSQFPAVGRTQVANGLSCGCQRCRESSHWTVSACDLFLPRRKDSLSKIFKAFTLFFFFSLLSWKKSKTTRMIPLLLIQTTNSFASLLFDWSLSLTCIHTDGVCSTSESLQAWGLMSPSFIWSYL